MFDLTGRTALVTGATGGIGGAIAKALHAQGATVAISGTRREALDALAGELKDRVHVLPCNLSDMTEVEALVSAAETMRKFRLMIQRQIWFRTSASRRIRASMPSVSMVSICSFRAFRRV